MDGTLHLRVVGADRASKSVDLPRPEATLGAVPGNDVVLDDPRVSSRHASLRLGPRGVELRDTSTNGTFVRGQRVQTAQLVQGEVVSIPPFEIEVRWSPATLASTGELARLAGSGGGAIELRPVEVRGGAPGGTMRVGATPVLLGAGAEAQARLGHSLVSGRHAELSTVGGLLKVRDLGSTNGTFLNGERVWLAYARPGDALAFGPDVWYVLESAP
jgi:pSer/pThr/pTyr-binding forkhead associated (FHA) protein